MDQPLECRAATVSDLFHKIIEHEIFRNIEFDKQEYCPNHFHVIDNKIEVTTVNKYAMFMHIEIKNDGPGLSLTFPSHNARLNGQHIHVLERGSQERLSLMLDYAWFETNRGLEASVTRGPDDKLSCWALHDDMCQRTETGFVIHGIRNIIGRVSAHVCTCQTEHRRVFNFFDVLSTE